MKPFTRVKTIAIFVCKQISFNLFKKEIAYKLCMQIIRLDYDLCNNAMKPFNCVQKTSSDSFKDLNQ